MKPRLLLTTLVLAVAPLWAADTPGTDPNIRQPSVQDRLANARKAVDRRDWSGAMRELNVAVKQAPNDADVHNLLGYTYRKRATPDMAKAMEHYNAALKFNPQHRGAHEYIGEAYLMQKRLSEAERHLVELERICGTGCEEYRDLAKSIADYKARN
ncbi:MAG TPA: tetratricopeptide repeat protein [Ramlibacter sp.]|jgi:Tfp pilus assembly protein PilF|nr:tetratricopeptide repeat protein [Ramlibacter sp.]